jgi:hypothetical protein
MLTSLLDEPRLITWRLGLSNLLALAVAIYPLLGILHLGGVPASANLETSPIGDDLHE